MHDSVETRVQTAVADRKMKVGGARAKGRPCATLAPRNSWCQLEHRRRERPEAFDSTTTPFSPINCCSDSIVAVLCIRILQRSSRNSHLTSASRSNSAIMVCSPVPTRSSTTMVCVYLDRHVAHVSVHWPSRLRIVPGQTHGDYDLLETSDTTMAATYGTAPTPSHDSTTRTLV